MGAPPICVLYVPGLDHRWITAADAPHLHRLLADHPPVLMQTQPTTEIFPSLITGVNPDRHELWHVSLRPDADAQRRRWYDALPDWATSTAQCLRYLVDRRFELPAIPPRRRRRFDLHRLKYDLRIDDPSMIQQVGGVPTLFATLGHDARYAVIKHFGDLDHWLTQLPDRRYPFDMVEFHAYDLASHWNIDRPATLRRYLRQLDAFVGQLRRQCADRRTTFTLLVDHGQEPVVGCINLRRHLRRLPVPDREYDYFLGVVVSRFWFHTPRARAAVTDLLRGLGHVRLFTAAEMGRWGCALDPRRFGELYAITEQGHLFFPHDFSNPLGDVYMGLKNPLLRPRLWNPRHRGYHGHVPDHPAELGYLCVADPTCTRAADVMQVVDFAPTMLALLGRPAEPHMQGRSVFHPPAAAPAGAA